MPYKMNHHINSKGQKVRLLFINLFLLTGVSVLVFTLLYLLFHLDNSDKIIYRCLPGFVFGLSSIIVYGFFNVNKTKNRKRFRFKPLN
jgi:hypothetical protein